MWALPVLLMMIRGTGPSWPRQCNLKGYNAVPVAGDHTGELAPTGLLHRTRKQVDHTHSHGCPKPARIGVPPPNRLLLQDRTFSSKCEPASDRHYKDPVPDENPRRVQARG